MTEPVRHSRQRVTLDEHTHRGGVIGGQPLVGIHPTIQSGRSPAAASSNRERLRPSSHPAAVARTGSVSSSWTSANPATAIASHPCFRRRAPRPRHTRSRPPPANRGSPLPPFRTGSRHTIMSLAPGRSRRATDDRCPGCRDTSSPRRSRDAPRHVLGRAGSSNGARRPRGTLGAARILRLGSRDAMRIAVVDELDPDRDFIGIDPVANERRRRLERSPGVTGGVLFFDEHAHPAVQPDQIMGRDAARREREPTDRALERADRGMQHHGLGPMSCAPRDDVGGREAVDPHGTRRILRGLRRPRAETSSATRRGARRAIGRARRLRRPRQLARRGSARLVLRAS